MPNILQKTIFLILFFSSVSFPSNAQESEFEPFRKTEIAINATQFIENLISFSNVSLLEQNASTILFKTGNGKLFFRSGMSLDHSRLEEDNSKLTSTLIGLRLGVERKSRIGNKWALNAGGGIVINSLSEKTTVSDPFFPGFDFSENTTMTGLEGVLGIQFFIGERIALSTESYFLASIGKTKNEQSGVNLPDEDLSLIKLIMPTSIYFSVYL